MDARDWFIAAIVGLVWVAGTVFLFQHPSAAAFATWATVCATMTGFYHWMVVRDSKTADVT